MQDGLFRKAAVEKASSPEQLDLLMTVTSPLGWLALLTIAVMLSGALVWSVWGEIPDKVDGDGIFFLGLSMREVKSSARGELVEFSLRKGDVIQEGQVIGQVKEDRADLEAKAAAKREEIARLRVTNEREDVSDDVARGSLQSQIDIARQQVRSAEADYQRQLELVNRGLRPRSVLRDPQFRIDSARSQIETLRQQGLSIDSKKPLRQRQLDNVQAELKLLEDKLQRMTIELRSPSSGRVVNVLKSAGDLVGEGESLLQYEPLSEVVEAGTGDWRKCEKQVHAIIYVPGANAGKVVSGMPVGISPKDVKKEEYGYMFGEVMRISSHAASAEELKATLKDSGRVQLIMQNGSVHEARVCLKPDPKTPSGYDWSSGKGPRKLIESGYECTASIQVGGRKPISYVLPIIKSTLGI